MASKRKKLGFFHLRKILFTGIMLCVSVIFFFPFYMMVMMATHATNELYTGIHLLPGTRGLYNAQIVLEAGFLQYYFNSLYVAVLVTAFCKIQLQRQGGFLCLHHDYHDDPAPDRACGICDGDETNRMAGQPSSTDCSPGGQCVRRLLDAPVRPLFYSHLHYGKRAD